MLETSMTPIKPIAILLAVFVTAAGSPGPEGTDLETQYGDQSKDLVDVTIPDEAVNLQRPGNLSNRSDGCSRCRVRGGDVRRGVQRRRSYSA
jgi:hypothetical protein